MLKLARLIKLMNNMQVTEQIFRALDIRVGAQSYMKVIASFFGIIVVFSHIFACYWFAIGTYHEGTGHDGGETSWVAFEGYSDSTVGEQYMAALYYILTTFSTVGYGDIAPVNELEQAFSCAAMIMGAGIFTYGITCVVSALNTSNPITLELSRRMDLLNVYMKNTKLPRPLRETMRAYIYRLADTYFIFREKDLIADLSPGLKAEVTMLTHFAMVKRVPFFRNADERCVRDIVSVLQMGLYVPDELIITEGDMGEAMYFIKKGKCQIFLQRNNTVLATLQDGNFFGETAIIMSQCRGASVKSVGYSVIFALAANDLKVVLKQYEAVRSAMIEAAEERSRSMAAGSSGNVSAAGEDPAMATRTSLAHRRRSCLAVPRCSTHSFRNSSQRPSASGGDRTVGAGLGVTGGASGTAPSFALESTMAVIDETADAVHELSRTLTKSAGTTELNRDAAQKLRFELKELTEEIKGSFKAAEKMIAKKARSNSCEVRAGSSKCRRSSTLNSSDGLSVSGDDRRSSTGDCDVEAGVATKEAMRMRRSRGNSIERITSQGVQSLTRSFSRTKKVSTDSVQSLNSCGSMNDSPSPSDGCQSSTGSQCEYVPPAGAGQRRSSEDARVAKRRSSEDARLKVSPGAGLSCSFNLTSSFQISSNSHRRTSRPLETIASARNLEDEMKDKQSQLANIDL
jgi:CRP-like cAMP-binding protein